MTNVEIVERLERLQDLMTGWVTDSRHDGDEQEYVDVRTQLFGLEGMKDAVP